MVEETLLLNSNNEKIRSTEIIENEDLVSESVDMMKLHIERMLVREEAGPRPQK
jgi:hypothetical protein